ncbi:MAG: PDDEXK nuclease domain-containing protein [Leadbetterella sp.]|nr:PDDEXK nuclease domain-containing protein [Leadbetterella sp.]
MAYHTIFLMPNNDSKIYLEVFYQLRKKVKETRQKAFLSVNTQLLTLYWNIGKVVSEQVKHANWGAKVIERLSKDLRNEFSDMKGLSFRNIKYMRQFAETYPDREFGQQIVAQIPWGHHVLLMDKIKSSDTALFYMTKTIENGWSRDILALQIKSKVHERIGRTVNNFDKITPEQGSDFIRDTFKDPYIFDFLTLRENFQEKDLENALTEHITKFLLELGAGFAFVGKQYPITVGGQDFFMDLLFYNIRLRSYVVIELKMGTFKPEYTGQLNFYLSVVDDQLKGEFDQPSIGLLLCQEKNKIVAEYALKDLNKPIGISAYEIAESIPSNLKASLPSTEEIESELSRIQAEE